MKPVTASHLSSSSGGGAAGGGTTRVEQQQKASSQSIGRQQQPARRRPPPTTPHTTHHTTPHYTPLHSNQYTLHVVHTIHYPVHTTPRARTHCSPQYTMYKPHTQDATTKKPTTSSQYTFTHTYNLTHCDCDIFSCSSCMLACTMNNKRGAKSLWFLCLRCPPTHINIDWTCAHSHTHLHKA